MQTTHIIALVSIVAIIILVLRRHNAQTHRFSLVTDTQGNESIVFDASLAGRSSLFLLDTAYAGAPVVSTSFLAVQDKCTVGSVQERFRTALRLMSSIDSNTRVTSVETLSTACRGFTSGCTMRLMGIGETVENQSDMLLCPAVALDGHTRTFDDIDADVLVTNPLMGSPHILTVDYLLHRAPCVIRPREGCVHFRLTIGQEMIMRPTFEFHETRMIGGAFAIPVDVGGARLVVVVDTGAATTISISSKAVDRLRTCETAASVRRVTQVGVNGERVCSNIVRAPVTIGGHSLGVLDIMANTSAVQGADGYMGMGVLRAFDLWLEHNRLGTRPSGLEARQTVTHTTAGACPGAPLPTCLSTANA